ncbi:MAG: hypothetical protein ACI3V4_10830, partial [Faecousia sp.]
TKAFPSGEGGPALAGSDEVGMHPDRYEHKEPWTEKIKQDNSFSVCLGLVQTFGAYQPHPPQCAHWGTFPKGEGMALPRQWNRRKINDHLYETLEVQLNRYLISILYPNSARMARGQRKIFCEFFVNFSSMHRKRGPEWALVHGKVTAKRKPVRDEFGNVHNLFILRDFITGILNPELIFIRK